MDNNIEIKDVFDFTDKKAILKFFEGPRSETPDDIGRYISILNGLMNKSLTKE